MEIIRLRKFSPPQTPGKPKNFRVIFDKNRTPTDKAKEAAVFKGRALEKTN